MPLNAKDITIVRPPPPPTPDVSAHVAAIDAMLAAPWHPWELVDGHGDQDHAGRVYSSSLTPAEIQEVTRLYRAAGWEVRWGVGTNFNGRLCFVPAQRPAEAP